MGEILSEAKNDNHTRSSLFDGMNTRKGASKSVQPLEGVSASHPLAPVGEEVLEGLPEGDPRLPASALPEL